MRKHSDPSAPPATADTCASENAMTDTPASADLSSEGASSQVTSSLASSSQKLSSQATPKSPFSVLPSHPLATGSKAKTKPIVLDPSAPQPRVPPPNYPRPQPKPEPDPIPDNNSNANDENAQQSTAHPRSTPESPISHDQAMLQNLIGLGDFSARKSYYPELLGKIDELEQEKERYEWLFENALHGIFQAKIDGPITAANPAIARICGYDSVAEFQQIGDIGQQLFFSEDYHRLLKLLQRDGQKVGFETQLKTRDGNAVSISTNVLLKDCQLGLIEAFVQDITARKQAESQLYQLNSELEQRVVDRTHELSSVNNQLSAVNQHLRQEIVERNQIEKALHAAKQEAEDANASKDKYLAAASHDLLQPLNAARLLVSALQGKELENDSQQLVERTHVALEGAEALLTDLLDIAKLDANAVTADLSLFSADQLIRSLQSETEQVAAKSGLRFRAVSSSVTVLSDSHLLIRILRNFISNAIRYTDHGGIVLGCRRRGDQLEFQVIDTGSGIPEDKRQEIFHEFHQLDNAKQSSNSREQGVGLGLAIVERIAKMLNHPIEVRSRPGSGSCFSILVPISKQQPQQTLNPPASMLMGADLSGVRVLVIENEESIRVGMRALLEQWQCQVETVENAQQALKAYNGNRADIILADYHLDKGATGVEVIEQLTQHYRASNQPVAPAIIITADRSNELRQLFQQKNLIRLNKPLKPGKLRALMSHLLQQQQP
ncbi:MAG: NahK/ErcS family hybrid sensor histidine kinase/response regulator [Motiliproteus sp.]